MLYTEPVRVALLVLELYFCSVLIGVSSIACVFDFVEDAAMSSVPVLYHAEGSYYSQLARLALAEKGIKYKSHLISLVTAEMHEEWYLRKVNPKGMLPALEHHGKYYTDSRDIMEYVDTLPAVNTKLCPDDSSEISERVGHFRDLLCSINVKIVTYGSIYHRHLTVNSQVPGFLSKEKIKERISSFGKDLAHIQQQSPDLKAGLKERRGLYDEAEIIFDEERVIAVLDDVDRIIGEVEEELQKQKAEFGDEEYWLCGQTFTIADIYLSCLLHRVTFLGHAQRFYLLKRPLVTDYYNRVLLRKSFHTACGYANSMFWSMILPLVRARLKKAGPFLIGAAALGIGVLAYYKRDQILELGNKIYTKFRLSSS